MGANYDAIYLEDDCIKRKIYDDLLNWKGNGDSEIDFLISTIDDGIIPIEVKADSHTKLAYF